MNAPQALPLSAGPAVDVSDVPSLHGVLPWRMTHRSGLRILLVGSGDGDWTVPAGAPVAERAGFLSAALHAFEEAGVIGEIDTVPLGDDRRGAAAADGGRDLRLRLFAMKVRGTLSHWKRQGERQRRWFSPQEAAGHVRDTALATSILAFAEDVRSSSAQK